MKKEFGAFTALSVVVGCVIGSGVFFKPQAIYTITGGAPGMGMAAWLVGGIVSIFAALTFTELAVMIPKTGGMVAYLGEVYGHKVGFLTGWMQTILFYPAMVAALAVIGSQQLSTFFGDRYLIPIALLLIVLVILSNAVGSKFGGGVQIASTICKLIPIGLIIVFGFVRGGNPAPISTPMVGIGLNPIATLGQLLLSVLFAFEGWTNVGAIAGEMKNPGKDLPKAIVGGVSVIMAVYFIINVAYLKVIPADQLATMAAPASAVAMALFGDFGGKLITIGIVISVFGTSNGFILAGSRVCYSLAVEGTLPGSAALSKLNGAQVPMNAILLIGGLSAVYALSGQFNMLTDLGIFTCWIFYTLTFLAVIKLRYERPDAVRTYRVPCYPVIPAIAIISGLFVIVNQLLFAGGRATIMSIGGIAITLAGLPIYTIMTEKNAKKRN
ncbi:MAG: amino acid permease [Oscillospiraceae bacterium]